MHARDMDLAASNALDSRKLDVVADGLSLWHGVSWPSTRPWHLRYDEVGQPRGEPPTTTSST